MEEKDMNITATENVDIGVEEQAVADPAVNEQVRQADTQPEAGKTDRDSFYADMRRKQELDEARAANAQLRRQIDAANTALGAFLHSGGIHNADSAVMPPLGADMLSAMVQRQDRVSALENQLKIYQQKEIDKQMEEDLRQIQSVDPSVTSLDDLPTSFLALRFNTAAPMGAKEAFIAMKAIEKQTKQPKPASTGSVTGTGAIDREFFTSDELDRLTKKDMADPKVYEKAMKSMARLK